MYNFKIASAENILFAELNAAANQMEGGLEVGSQIVKAALAAMDKHSAQYLLMFKQFLNKLSKTETLLMDRTKKEIGLMQTQIDEILRAYKI